MKSAPPNERRRNDPHRSLVVQPRSGERMQPTEPAVGDKRKMSKPRRGERKATVQDSGRRSLREPSHIRSCAHPGLNDLHRCPHGLRRGLYSFAPSELSQKRPTINAPVSKRCTSDDRFCPSCRPIGTMPTFRQPATSTIQTTYLYTHIFVHTDMSINVFLQEHFYKLHLCSCRNIFRPNPAPNRPKTPTARSGERPRPHMALAQASDIIVKQRRTDLRSSNGNPEDR